MAAASKGYGIELDEEMFATDGDINILELENKNPEILQEQANQITGDRIIGWLNKAVGNQSAN